jgi:hypothetical protein
MTAWWKARGRTFFLTAVAVALVLVVVGWVTGLRATMHVAFLALATVAFLPFVLVAGGLLVVMALGLFIGLVSAAAHEHPPGVDGLAEVVVKGGHWFGARYYRLIARQRHPVFWGVPAGALFGALVLWALIAAIILPGEARTVRVLAQAKEQIDQEYRANGAFPRPDADGHLVRDGVVLDGFARPLRYEVAGAWKFSSWVLTSPGFDGREGTDDDLCISGATTLADRAAQIRDLLKGAASTQDTLLGIRTLRCLPR